MRTFELRVYKLRSKEALDFYMNEVYPRHLTSFPLFGIEGHGFWTAKEDAEPRLFVLASYAAGDEPGEVAQRYMQSKEFADDIRTALMYRTSLALNRRFSYLQQVLLLSDLTHSRAVGNGGMHDGSPKRCRNHRRWIDGWK